MNILVTAGPTREHLDPVRFLSNRSSGKMGYSLAVAARQRGHAVTLISGPVALAAPSGIEMVRVISAQDMLEAVERSLSWCDVLIMSAAVADWRPAVCRPVKVKKDSMPSLLELERTPDILQTIAPCKANRIFVGFAAETDHVLEEAARKLREKKLDLIVANDVSRADAGFEVDTNQVSLLEPGCPRIDLPLLGKDEVAGRILDWIESRYRANAGVRP